MWRIFLIGLGCLLAFSMVSQTIAQTEILTFSGTLDDQTPFYEYPLLINTDHTTIIADSRATSGDLDTILYLLDNAGNVLGQNDNRRRGVLDAYLLYPSAKAGAYTLVLARYEVADGTTSGDFVLDITLTPTVSDLPPYDISPQALADLGYPTQDPAPVAEWTVLAYYGGDTDLEGAIVADLIEFERAGGSDGINLHIVALLDRNPGYSTVSGDWHTTKLFYVTATLGDNADNVVISSRELADLGDLDSGDGATLAQFMAWGIRHYPAKHYALAFGSHGAGWAGVITDNTSGSIITLPELQQALITVDTPLALLINDACLMSSVEYHAVIAPYVQWSFASPEIVVDPALDMTLFTDNLRRSTADALPTIGQALVDKYMTQDILSRSGGDIAYLTNAVTDLSHFDPVVEAVETFASIFLEDPARHSAMLGVARGKTYTYTAFKNGASLIDLGSLMRQVIATSTDDRLIAAAQAVVSALRHSVVYGSGGERVQGRVLYQNIYFPDRARDFSTDYFRYTPLTHWGAMLRAYYNALTPRVWRGGTLFHPPVSPQVFITTQYPDAPSIHNPVRFNIEIIGRNIGRGIFIADFLLPDGTYERYIELPILAELLDDQTGEPISVNEWGSGVEISTFLWDVNAYQLSDGITTRPILARAADETFSVEGRYREADGAVWYDVVIIFSADDASGTYVATRVISRDPNSDALGVVVFETGSIFQPYRVKISPDGAPQIVPDETTNFVWHENGFMLKVIPAPDGAYNLGFRIETFTGEQTLATVPIQIRNAGLDPSLRGMTNLDWGYTLLLSADWTDLSPTEQGYALAEHLSDPLQVRVYEYTVTTFDFTVDLLLDILGYTLYDRTPITIGGQQTEYVLYGNATQIGYGLYLVNANQDALLIGIETWDESLFEAQLLEVAQAIWDTVSLFDNATLLLNDTALWTGRLIGSSQGNAVGASYYLPKTWEAQYFEDGIWIGSAPSTDADSPQTATTQFRVAQVVADDNDLFHVALRDDYIANQPNYALTSERPYYAQFNDWRVSLFTYTQDGTPITGRLYTTVTPFGVGYAIWQIAPTENASTLFSQVFEPLVDAFRPNIPLRSYPLPDVGVVFNIPRDWDYPVFEDNYLYTYDAQVTVEYALDFYTHSGDYEDTLYEWLDTWGYALLSDPQPYAVKGKDGWLVEYEAYDEDEYSALYGYGFLTTSSDGLVDMVFYLLWLDASAPDIGYFEYLLGLHDYGTAIAQLPEGIAYERGWVTVADAGIGLELSYPNSWGKVQPIGNMGYGGYVYIESATTHSRIVIYVGLSDDVEALLEEVYSEDFITLTPMDDVEIDGALWWAWDIMIDDDPPLQGVVVGFVGAGGYAYLIELVNDKRGDSASLLPEFWASIRSFELEE